MKKCQKNKRENNEISNEKRNIMVKRKKSIMIINWQIDNMKDEVIKLLIK